MSRTNEDYGTIIIIDGEDHKSVLYKGYFNFSDKLFEKLKSKIDWEYPIFQIHGKSHPSPRGMKSYGKISGKMQYSKISVSTLDWNETPVGRYIKRLSKKITRLTSVKYNSCLVNFYRDGNDSISPHSDKPELDLAKSIITVTISNGQRAFVLRNKHTHESTKVMVDNGDILTMEGEFQQHYTHAIPKMKNRNIERISLTYRCV